MSITERLANLSIPQVLIIVAVLLIARFLLLRQRAPIAKSIGEMAESLAIAMVLVFLIIRPFFIQAFFIPSESMEPGLLTHDHIMVNKLIYRIGQPKRGDVIVFKSPPEAMKNEADFIKRVIAIPGDTVRITPGYIMINDSRYDHKDIKDLIGTDELNTRIKLEKNHVVANGKSYTPAEVAAAAGEPNAKVKIVPGQVYINDKPIAEKYTAEDPDQPYPLMNVPVPPDKWIAVENKGKQQIQLVKIPKGKLLVMGDNRNNSFDARFWGLLDRSRVEGKAMFIFWPIGRIRWIH